MTAFPGSSDIDETEKSMKRVTALLLLLTLLLCACSKEAVYTFEKDGTLTDKSGNAYYSAPVGYEPTNQGDKYGKIDDALGETLYQVGDLDPEDYLTGEYSGGATSFFYSVDIDLPALWEMNPSLCYLCQQETNIITVCTIGDGSQSGSADSDKKVIETVISRMHTAIETGSSESIWPRGDVNETYQLKFYSDEWPAFYYNLTLAVCGGGAYLYDRQSKICINLEDLLVPYYEASAADSVTEADI